MVSSQTCAIGRQLTPTSWQIMENFARRKETVL